MLMWIIKILFIAQGFLYNCFENWDRELYTCKENYRFPRSFPTNKDDFNHICSTSIPVLDCTMNVTESCGSRGERQKLCHMSRFLSGLRYVCTESFSINKVIGDNLLCYKDAVASSESTCSMFGSMMSFYDTVEGVSDDVDGFTCLEYSSEMVCSLSHIENKCGEKAHAAFLDAVMSLGVLEIFCRAQPAQKIFQELQRKWQDDEVRRELKDLLKVN